jgi:hypothetical protein
LVGADGDGVVGAGWAVGWFRPDKFVTILHQIGSCKKFSAITGGFTAGGVEGHAQLGVWG